MSYRPIVLFLAFLLITMTLTFTSTVSAAEGGDSLDLTGADSGNLSYDESWEIIIEEGVFEYYCIPHKEISGDPWMYGKITTDPNATLGGVVVISIIEDHLTGVNGYGYGPEDVVVKPGTRVIFYNEGEAVHTVTAYENSTGTYQLPEAPAGEEHGVPKEVSEFGINSLAYWVGIYSFAFVLLFMLVVFFWIRYGEGSHVTGAKDKKDSEKLKDAKKEIRELKNQLKGQAAPAPPTEE